MGILQVLVRKIFYRTAEKNAYWYKKNTDIRMGKNCRIFSSASIGSEPYLIEIGDNVEITEGVRLLTHDGGVKVPMQLGLIDNADLFGRIKIGNNVFIGVNSVILPGTQIGDNVIVGAGSIVTKNISSNSVACGVPAKVITSVEEYCEKNMYRIFDTDDKSYEEKKHIIESKLPYSKENKKGWG